MTPPFALSTLVRRAPEQAINYYMKQALENPHLISLAAGLVDQESLPMVEVRQAVNDLLAHPETARVALQYGTTQGYAPLRERVRRHVARLDGLPPERLCVSADEVLITTGSQQLLYLLGEALLDPGDLVITEAPSYFVEHGVLATRGAHVLTVPMDDDGMKIDALEATLADLARRGEIERLKMIYTCDWFQNPSGRTLSRDRRPGLAELARRFSRHHRILILEDAAYREINFGDEHLPSVKSFDNENQYVVYAGTFSKPCSPGLKTGYSLLPRELLDPILRLKGLHDFGSANLAQQILNRLLSDGSYDRHVLELKVRYRAKCDAMLAALDESFGDWPDVRWTRPAGGMFIWLAMPEEIETGPGSMLLGEALREGMLYVPGEFCHVPDERGQIRRCEMRLCYGVEPVGRIREAIRRLRRAAERVRHSSGLAEVPGRRTA